MRSNWRGVDKLPPSDEDIKLVKTQVGVITLARFIDDMWIDEHTNRLLEVIWWCPIAETPDE